MGRKGRDEEMLSKNIIFSKSRRASIMTLKTFRYLETKEAKPPICLKCSQLIRVDQDYYFVSRRYGTRRYHLECAIKLNIL